MRNHEVTARQQLLDENGVLNEPGWSRSLVQIYDRSRIKAPAFQIKEWDYYLVLNEDFPGRGDHHGIHLGLSKRDITLKILSLPEIPVFTENPPLFILLSKLHMKPFIMVDHMPLLGGRRHMEPSHGKRIQDRLCMLPSFPEIQQRYGLQTDIPVVRYGKCPCKVLIQHKIRI